MTSLKNKDLELSSVAEEPAVAYCNTLPRLFDVRPAFGYTGLSPIIKWPGGKEKELTHILNALPVFSRYIEPFVGGGSVFMGIAAQEYIINDFSSELISIYRLIKEDDEAFYCYSRAIDNSWERAKLFFEANTVLVEMYNSFVCNKLSVADLKAQLSRFCTEKQTDILSILPKELRALSCVLAQQLYDNLQRKMQRMRVLEEQNGRLPDSDINDNIETAIKSALYMNYRSLYNSPDIRQMQPKLYAALFLFIRNYAYSGMFRYSKSGEFNVPYGGIAYNSKYLAKKLKFYKSEEVKQHFALTDIYNLDFEDFLNQIKPTAEDFIFLDPPYDTEFSTYAKNAFTKEDQKRLANYLINQCQAKWMMIIKNTEFIYSLYDKPGIRISSFEKNYTVSFMNRNNKKVTHLIITNYK